MFARISGRKIGWTLALSISLACSRLAEGADEATLLRQIKSADLQLNEDYKTVLRALSKSGQEQLRVAERAWLIFIIKNEEAVAAVAQAHPAAGALVLEARLADIRHRCEELRAMLGEQPASVATVSLSSAAQADAELNQVYQQCLRTLSVGAERRLREAQRVWIEFRDKHAAATSGRISAVPSPTLLALHRLQSLKAIYLGAPADSGPSKPATVAEDKQRSVPNSSIPDPFATAR